MRRKVALAAATAAFLLAGCGRTVPPPASLTPPPTPTRTPVLSAEAVTVPRLIGLSVVDATTTLAASGLLPDGPGLAPDAVVLAQSPPELWSVPRGTAIRFQPSDDVNAEEVGAAIEAAESKTGSGFRLLEVVHSPSDPKVAGCAGRDDCVAVRLTDADRAATLVVRLLDTTIVEVSQLSAPDSPPRLRSEEEVVALALDDPAVISWVGGRTVRSTASAGGGDGPWCGPGPDPYVGNYCDTVFVSVEGQGSGPLLVSVNWLTGAVGIAGQGS
jgi:hypothetical protein